MAATRDFEGPGFDPDAWRARYCAERDKGLRPKGIHQFIEPAGDFQRVDPESRRAWGTSQTPWPPS